MKVWQKIPVSVQAVIAGSLVAVAGTLPWSFLVSQNLKHFPSIPWAVPVTAVNLFLLWGCMRRF